MHILVDVRALMDRHISGVGMYTTQILRALLQELQEDDRVTLWYNSKKEDRDEHMNVQLTPFLVDSRVHCLRTRMSNKLFAVYARMPWCKDFLDFLSLEKQPDVIFLPDVRPLFPTTIPVVTTVHDMSFYDYPIGYSWQTRLWHACLAPKARMQQSTHIIAVSEFTKERILAHTKIGAEHITVVYEGAEMQEAAKPSFLPTTPFFVTLCTLEPRKNLRFTLTEFLTWNEQQDTPYHMCVLGDYNTDIFQQEELPTSPWIHYCGRVTEGEKSWYLSHALGLVYVSFYEGFGLPVLEAATLGTPAIVATGSSLLEIAGKGAVAIRPQDTVGYHKGLSQLTIRETRTILAEAAKQQSQKFSWTQAAKETYDILRTCSE